MTTDEGGALCAFLLCVLPVSLVVLGLSRRYGVSAGYVARTAMRAVVLGCIEKALVWHDPFQARRTVTSLGEGSVPSGPANEESLAELVGLLFPLKEVEVTSHDNRPIVSGRYRFGYQGADHPTLARLREKYAAFGPSGGCNDFQRILSIADRVSSCWEHGTNGAPHFDPVRFDAGRILEAAAAGAEFWCHVYAMTLIQLCSAWGMQGRLVSLTKDGYDTADNHSVAEIWSNHYGKWIVVDADFNIWYRREGMPLSALEIHDAVVGGKQDQVEVVKERHRPALEYERRIPTLWKYYRYLEVDLRNDWATNSYPPGHPARSDKATLCWQDRRLPPVLNLKRKSSCHEDLYWDLNRSHLRFGPTLGWKTLAVWIETVTPDFAYFEVAGDSGATAMLDSAYFEWPLHEGENSITVRAVNASGCRGILSSVSLRIGR